MSCESLDEFSRNWDPLEGTRRLPHVDLFESGRNIIKQQLQRMRDDGWVSYLNTISLFGIKHKIHIPNMEDMFVFQKRSGHNVEESTNLHYYSMEMFYEMIDSQLQELNNHFNEVNMEFLLCMICHDPTNSFSTYDKTKLFRFVEFYLINFQ